MTIDMNKLLAFIDVNKKKGNTEKKKDGPKIQYWRPPVGETQVRWLPCEDNGYPAFVLYYYDNEDFYGQRRFLCPFQYEKDDPIKTFIDEKMSGKRLSKEEFVKMMRISPKPSFVIPILVRGEESKGVQYWELNADKFKKLCMKTFANIDYRDEPITDIKTGRDILVVCSETDKFFRGKRSTEWDATVRVKQTKLANTNEESNAIVSKIENPRELLKVYLKNDEAIRAILENALSGGADTAGELGTERGASSSKKTVSKEDHDATEKALDSAFGDDDDVF